MEKKSMNNNLLPNLENLKDVLFKLEKSKGVYSNVALIRHMKNEFIIDFLLQIGNESQSVSRVVISPEHAVALTDALKKNIELYEKNIGKIMAGETLKHKIVLINNFEKQLKWSAYKLGKVSRTNELSKSGTHSLKKEGHGDPNGGYEVLWKKISLSQGIVFSGWLYRPSKFQLNLDRLALENEKFTGIGFAVDHKRELTYIERREQGNPKRISAAIQCKIPLDAWYHFKLQISLEKYSLKLSNEKMKELVNLSVESDLSSFEVDRVVVHGGYPYYVDDLKVEVLR